MNRLFFITFFCIIFLISSASSVNLGISPDRIELSGNQNEKICENFSIFGNNPETFHGDIKWSKNNSKALFDYNLSSSELRINPVYPEIANPGKYPICISAEDAGLYHGALMYRLENSSYGIGTWIELKVIKNSLREEISFLSGKIIKNAEPVKIESIFFLGLLSIILIFLLIKLRKKSMKKLC